MAADDFLRIDGIPGESADSKHKGETDVESFSWGDALERSRAGLAAGALLQA